MVGLTNPLAFFGFDAGAATIRQAHAQRLLAAAQGAEIRHGSVNPACHKRLPSNPVVCRSGTKHDRQCQAYMDRSSKASITVRVSASDQNMSGTRKRETNCETRHSPQDASCLVVSIFRLKIMWCGWRDLNPHALRRQNLNLVRLPIPPHPQ